MPNITWELPVEAWSAFVARCPDATFFHTPEWYAAHGLPTATPLIRFEDGAEALLPLAVSRRFRGLVAEGLAGLENGYGGLVSPGPLTDAQVNAAYALVRQRFPDLAVVGNPFGAYPNLPAGSPLALDATQVLPVVDREAQRKLMVATRRKHVAKALEAGFRLEVRTALQAEDAASFYPLYAERAAGWTYTKWVRDEAYFRRLCEAAGAKLALFLAYKNDELAGFRLLGLQGPVVMDLFLATAERHDRDQVGPYLVVEPLAWLHERGYELFDFQPSGRLEGVKAYKASFGATPREHATTRQAGWVGRGLDALLRRSA
ncbi:MAG: putative methicillin resistance protein [Cyanobacteria bacterium RYN_339]|nr:putative methicillin resistance protein [Cyanobacteria bacterium RYN_339]